jgi:hypothetical protein
MKLLKKASLAAAIAAAPFAAQALQPLDDATLSNATGQAGVNIDISIPTSGISIDQVLYTDTDDGAADTTPKGGSVAINNIGVTGVYGNTADNVAAGRVGNAAELIINQTIDVDADGDLVIGMNTDANVDLLVSVGDVQLQDSTQTTLNSELVNGLDMQVSIGAASTTRINNVDIANETLADFGIVGSKAGNTAGIVIESDMAVAVRDLDVGVFGYTADQANLLRTSREANNISVGDLDGNGTADEAADYDAYETAVATRSAVQINNLTFDDGAGGLVNVSQKIWADGDGVNIQMGNISGTLTIGSIGIGGGNIGSVAVSGINLAGMTQTISGR